MKRIFTVICLLTILILSGCGVKAPIPEIGGFDIAPTVSARSVVPGTVVDESPTNFAAGFVPGLIGASDDTPIEIGETWQDTWLNIGIEKVVKGITPGAVTYSGNDNEAIPTFEFELVLQRSTKEFNYIQTCFYGFNSGFSVLSHTNFDGQLNGNYFDGTGVLQVITFSDNITSTASIIKANLTVTRNDAEGYLEVVINNWEESDSFPFTGTDISIDSWETLWGNYFLTATELSPFSVTYRLPDGGVWEEISQS